MTNRIREQAHEFAYHMLLKGYRVSDIMERLEIQFGDPLEYEFVLLQRGDKKVIQMVYESSAPSLDILTIEGQHP